MNTSIAMKPAMSSGPRMVPIRNVLVCTNSRNSRFMTTKVLDMGPHLRHDFIARANLVEENLLERGLSVLETFEPHVSIDEVLQQLLRIRAIFHIDLQRARVLTHLGHHRMTAYFLDRLG